MHSNFSHTHPRLLQEAGKREAALRRHREMNNMSDLINLDLTFAVGFNLAVQQEANKMYTQVCKSALARTHSTKKKKKVMGRGKKPIFRTIVSRGKRIFLPFHSVPFPFFVVVLAPQIWYFVLAPTRARTRTQALETYSVLVRNKQQYANSGRLRVNMGNIYYTQKKYPAAIKMYRMAVDQVGW